MPIITFFNNEKKETGQTLSSLAVASVYAIEHNLSVLYIPTDYQDKTVEDALFNERKKKNFGFLSDFMVSNTTTDLSNGIEGLIRVFASNRGSADIIKSYTKPVLMDRFDVLLPLRTADKTDYINLTKYYTAIIEAANKVYDIVIVDLYNYFPEETKKRILALSNLNILSLTQNNQCISRMQLLKEKDPFYRKNNLILAIGKYDRYSAYTNKNIARFLKEKNNPIVIPYNISYADACMDGKIIDYLLQIGKLTFRDGPEGYFYDEVRNAVEKIDANKNIPVI